MKCVGVFSWFFQMQKPDQKDYDSKTNSQVIAKLPHSLIKNKNLIKH